MPTAEEMFAHIHRDGLRDLALARSEANQQDDPVPATPAIMFTLRNEYRTMLNAVIEKLTVDKPEPEIVFRNGLASLELIQRFRFVVENLLEAVKRDDSLNNSATRYVALGLLTFPTTNFPDEARTSPWPSNAGSGRILNKMMNGLRRVALTVIEIVMNAVKIIPKLVEIKPNIIIGWTGPFPTFSLSFDLQADSISIHDLFNDLKGAHST